MIDPKLVSRYHDAGCIVVREKLLSGQNRGLRCTMKIRCRLRSEAAVRI